MCYDLGKSTADKAVASVETKTELVESVRLFTDEEIAEIEGK